MANKTKKLVRREYTKTEEKELRAHSNARTPVKKIAKLTKRTEGALRAKVDPKHNWKWLGEADRWRELGHNQIAWRFQKRNVQQQMHAGPMAIGLNTIYGDSRSKQQG